MEASDASTAFGWRLKQVESGYERNAGRLDQAESKLAVHTEQISGAGGLIKAMEKLGEKVDSLNRALYTFAGSFVIAAVTIAVTLH